MASAPAVATAAPAPHVSSFAGIHKGALTSPRLSKQTEAQRHKPAPLSAPQPYEYEAPFDPLLAQAEELEHALIRARFHPSLGSTDAFAHLRRPIERIPSTAPVIQEPPSTSALLALPTEIHIELAKWLPWNSQWSLKRTCHHFHSVPELAAPISFFNLRHRGKTYQQNLLMALCSAGIVRRGYEPCYACRRFRWKTNFEIAQYQRGFLWCDGGEDPLAYGAPIWGSGKDGSVYENGKFCIECGVKASKYEVGETLEVVQEWSDYHSDRQSIVVNAPSPPSVLDGQQPVQERRKTSGVMISMQGEEDMERKFNEVGLDDKVKVTTELGSQTDSADDLVVTQRDAEAKDAVGIRLRPRCEVPLSSLFSFLA